MDEEWVTTSTILQRMQGGGDTLAWNRFVDRFRGPVVAFALRQGLSPAEAEDAAQETLLAFSNALRDGRYDSSRGRLSQWLFGFARLRTRRARSDAARREREAHAVDTDFWDEQGDEEGRERWDQEWERVMAERAISRARREVAPATFEAFELSVRLDLPAEEVASRLGIPVKAVYNAKHRVLKRMRRIRAELEEPF